MNMKQYWNAIILAIILGWLGIQEFYLGNTGRGILAVLFWWTGIPALIAFVEAGVWLYNGEDYFNDKYNKKTNNQPLNS